MTANSEDTKSTIIERHDHPAITILDQIIKTFIYADEKDNQYTMRTYMSSLELNTLQINDKIDHRNPFGKFVGATIIGKKKTELQILYDNSDKKHETWSDYAIERHKFATYGAISRCTDNNVNKITIFNALEIDDDVDINPIYNGHAGWRCGGIEEIDIESHQVNVIYEIDGDDEYYTIWIDLQNDTEIAPTGTKVDPLQMLQRHYYDPYFDLKHNEHNLDLINKKVLNCFNYIKNDIIPRKQNDIVSLVEYINRMRCDLYEYIICCKIKHLVNDKYFTHMDALFKQMYSVIVNDLKIIKDKFHLDVSKEFYSIDTSNLLEESKQLSEETVSKLQKIKIGWQIILHDEQCPKENVSECSALKRVKQLFQIFDTYCIQYRYQKETKSNDVPLDFMLIYHKCICDNKYSIVRFINDCHHIQKHHINDILHKKHLIPKCKHNECINCISTKRELHLSGCYFGYKSSYEIHIIQTMIQYHVYLQHTNIMDQSVNLARIKHKTENNKDNTKINSARIKNKFVTSAIKMEHTKNTNTDTITFPKFISGDNFYYSKYFKNYPNYIKSAKHKTLKDELLSNNIFPIHLSIFKSFLKKAITYSLVDTAKHLQAYNRGKDNTEFEVPVDAPITISQLLCIIIYTDTDELQKQFKEKGCRQNFEKIPLKERIQQNAEIGNWYWLFCQTVYIYGINPVSSSIFYHGLDIKLLFPSFKPAFDCPISTTNEFSVAQRFGIEGIILKLKPTVLSRDTCFSVSWISAHPDEHEYIFCSARSLTIYDIRYVDNECDLRYIHEYDLNAMRLFDCIMNKNCSYDYNLFNKKTQQLLIRYLKYATFMDEIGTFNIENRFKQLNDYMCNEEYDSDAFKVDIDDFQNSNIFQCFSTCNGFNNEEKQLFKDYYQKNYLKIPIYSYLRQMFRFMKQRLLQWICDTNKIHIIKSEYYKLEKELQNELSKLYSEKDVIYIQEFEWKIQKEEFISLKRGESINGPSFKWKINTNNNEFVIFHPLFFKSDASFLKYSAIGITIDTVPSTVTTSWFCWSFSVDLEQTRYVWDSEREICAQNSSYDCLKAFPNNKLISLTEFIIKIYIRNKI